MTSPVAMVSLLLAGTSVLLRQVAGDPLQKEHQQFAMALADDEAVCSLQDELVDVTPTGGVISHSSQMVFQEMDMTNLLQASVQSSEGERAALTTKATQASSALLVPTASDTISQSYWSEAEKILQRASMTTPKPLAASLNAPATTPKPMGWQEVMNEGSQPVDTKLGAAILNRLSLPVTQTPPPTQDATDSQFVAQCPMVLIQNDLQIRAPSCNHTHGRWIDPSPLNVRTVVRWDPLQAGGLYFGVDSKISGLGKVGFATVRQELTLKTYQFSMKNCVGVDRWEIEELVYKIKDMGRVSSTLDLHDVNMNGVAYFFRYVVRRAGGPIVAESTMYRMGTNQVNFTEYRNGLSTRKILAISTKAGKWVKNGWSKCMGPTSPRGWNINFPVDPKTTNAQHASMGTVQDLRFAIAGAITLMAHRDEARGDDGINTEGSGGQMTIVVGGCVLFCLIVVLLTNCCMVIKGSGLRDKLKKILFDADGTLLPKRPHQSRAPSLHPTY
jgi:hypothetical protein